MDGLDGNAAAGELAEVFATDVTVASVRCTGCGRVCALAQARMFGPEPGLVLRCDACEAVLLRLVRLPDRTVLDMRGLAYIELAAIDSAR
jgi:hypothetical protein